MQVQTRASSRGHNRSRVGAILSLLNPSETPRQPLGQGFAAGRAHRRVEQSFEGCAKLQEPALGRAGHTIGHDRRGDVVPLCIRTRARVKSSYQSIDFLPALPFIDFRSVAATRQASEMAFIPSQKSLRNSPALVFNSRFFPGLLLFWWPPLFGALHENLFAVPAGLVRPSGNPSRSLSMLQR